MLIALFFLHHPAQIRPCYLISVATPSASLIWHVPSVRNPTTLINAVFLPVATYLVISACPTNQQSGRTVVVILSQTYSNAHSKSFFSLPWRFSPIVSPRSRIYTVASFCAIACEIREWSDERVWC